MGQRTINKGTQDLTVTNLTANRLVITTAALAPGESKNIALRDYVNQVDRGEELAALVTNGSISVVKDGLTLTAADLQSLDAVETSIVPVPVLADATRGDPTVVPVGTVILNTTDGTLNVNDGTDWIDVTTGLPT